MYPTTQYQGNTYATEKSHYSSLLDSSIPNNNNNNNNPLLPLHHYNPDPPSFTYLPHSSFPNSNPDPPPLYSSYDSQSSSFLQDFNLSSASWVVKEAAAVKYSPAVPPLNTGTVTSTSYDASLLNISAHAIPYGNIPKWNLKKPKTILKKANTGPKIRCELCKIECTNVQIYEKHLSGKRHTKNIQKTYAPGAASTSAPALLTNRFIKQNTPGGPGIAKVPADLETKKMKLLEGGTAVQSLKVCAVCNVACNGEIAYADHLAGKKHLSKVRSLCPVANINTNSVSNRISMETKTAGVAYCEVCKISCTSNDGLIIHTKGKKHKKNLEKATSTITLKAVKAKQEKISTNPPTGNTEATNAESFCQKKKKARSKDKESEDVETKKRKVLECGAAADAVKTCTICNVVCNSELVFKGHLAGQKHAAMLKQAAGGQPEAEAAADTKTTSEQQQV